MYRYFAKWGTLLRDKHCELGREVFHFDPKQGL